MKNLLPVLTLVVLALVLVLFFRNYGCKLNCEGVSREGMMAGLATTSGLSLYNKDRQCFGGNILGSSDPYCSQTGYILF